MLAMHAHAAYLKDVPITITQPDGTVIHCFATGDEYYNWAHDANGYTIIQDSRTGYYCYAILNGDELTASRYVVGTVTPQSVDLMPNVNISAEKIRKKVDEFYQGNPPQSRTNQNLGNQTRGFTGTVNNIVVYIRFANQTEFPAVQGTKYTPMFNNTSSGYNSMRNYFQEVSYNQLDVVSHFYPTNNGTVIVSYQDSHDSLYYHPYKAGTNPNGYKDTERQNRERTLLVNAIDYINSLNQISPSLNIDYNNDGAVDNICFIVRGSNTLGGGSGTILWPHQWTLLQLPLVRINGKVVCNYNLQVENYLNSHGNGVLCHEMNHTFGAPDLYHSNDYALPVSDYWDLMAGSDDSPPQHMGAYMKYKYGGWISTIPEITTSGTYTLQPLTSATNNCYKIPINGSSQYFVVEYRKKTGTFESRLPDSGLIIYRINESYYGNYYDGAGAGGVKDEVYIFRYDGTISNDGTVYYANFSETSMCRTTFGNSTNPYCFLADGSLGNIYIKNIRENSNGTLSFDIKLCDGYNKTYTNNYNLPTLTKVSNTIQTLGAVVVKNTDNVTFEAGNEIILGPGFEIQAGGTFEIDMNGCGEK